MSDSRTDHPDSSAPAGVDRLRLLVRSLPGDLIAGIAGFLLALLALWYLHDRWLPWWALGCAVLGGVLGRRSARPLYASFPAYVRRPLSTGVVATGTLIAVWATLAREPASYWLLRWREALTLPLVAAILGMALSAVIYTYSRLERELAHRRLLEQDMRVARDIQQSLLERRPLTVDWLDVHATNVPSRLVGGDYYEIVEPEEDHLCVAVGDVSGKGVPAALLMSTLQSAFLAAHSIDSRLDRVCGHVNRFLHERSTPERYATFFVADVDRAGTIRYVNAGHNPPLLVGGSAPRRLSGGGLPLGLFHEAEYTQQQLRIDPGQSLVIYTDGITETVDGDGEEFGEQRLIDAIAAADPNSAEGIASEVLAAVKNHAGADPDPGDDITLLVLHYGETAT